MAKSFRFNLIEYLSPNLGMPIVTYNHLKFNCPICDAGNKYNLEVRLDPEYTVFNCWSCHYKGYITKLLKEYANDTSWRHLEEFKRNDFVKKVSEEKEILLPTGRIPFYLKKDVEEYLVMERNISKLLLTQRNVSYVYDEEHSLYNHIIFPFYDKDGKKLKGFTVQNFSTKKYKNFGRRNFIPYIQFLNEKFPIVITEGIYDALSIYNAIPLLGDDISEVILKYCSNKKIILALDNDVKETHKENLIEKLKHYNSNIIYVLNNKKYKDLNEFNQKDNEGLRIKYYNIINTLQNS